MPSPIKLHLSLVLQEGATSDVIFSTTVSASSLVADADGAEIAPLLSRIQNDLAQIMLAAAGDLNTDPDPDVVPWPELEKMYGSEARGSYVVEERDAFAPASAGITLQEFVAAHMTPEAALQQAGLAPASASDTIPALKFGELHMAYAPPASNDPNDIMNGGYVYHNVYLGHVPPAKFDAVRAMLRGLGVKDENSPFDGHTRSILSFSDAEQARKAATHVELAGGKSWTEGVFR